MQKNYSSRKNVEYLIFDRRLRFLRHNYRTMIRCECGKRFKKQKGNNVCPSCGLVITEETTVKYIGNSSWFNSSNTMFIDDGKITVSCVLLSISKETYYPKIGEHAIRLKVRYDIVNRRAVAYLQKFRCSEDVWSCVKLPCKFLNYTQPSEFNMLEKFDILLPTELVNDFCDIIGVESPNKGLGVKELAWMNRTRKPLKESMRECTIFSKLKILSEDKLVKKAFNKVKKYLKTGEKSKDYDEIVFKGLCKSMSVNVDTIPKDLIRFYYQNPVAISCAQTHIKLFDNRDIRINAILSDSGKNGYYRLRDSDVDAIKTTFCNESSLLKKMNVADTMWLLVDTANMISELKNEGIAFKTKGSLEELHEKAYAEYSVLKIPRNIAFENCKDISNTKINNNNFIFAKTTDDLINVGKEMNICVASYYQYCISGLIYIVYVRNKNNETVACLEIKGKELQQAKSLHNSIIPIKIQKDILKFCNQNNIYITTLDIDSNIRISNRNYFEKRKTA